MCRSIPAGQRGAAAPAEARSLAYARVHGGCCASSSGSANNQKAAADDFLTAAIDVAIKILVRALLYSTGNSSQIGAKFNCHPLFQELLKIQMPQYDLIMRTRSTISFSKQVREIPTGVWTAASIRADPKLAEQASPETIAHVTVRREHAYRGLARQVARPAIGVPAHLCGRQERKIGCVPSSRRHAIRAWDRQFSSLGACRFSTNGS
jgi:hypothetical protein